MSRVLRLGRRRFGYVDPDLFGWCNDANRLLQVTAPEDDKASKEWTARNTSVKHHEGNL